MVSGLLWASFISNLVVIDNVEKHLDFLSTVRRWYFTEKNIYCSFSIFWVVLLNKKRHGTLPRRSPEPIRIEADANRNADI